MMYTLAIHRHLEVGLNEKVQTGSFARGQKAENGGRVIVPFRFLFRVGGEAHHQFRGGGAPGRPRRAVPFQRLMLQQVMLLAFAGLAPRFNRALPPVFKMNLRQHMLLRTATSLGEREVQHVHRLQRHQHVRINRLRLFEHCRRRPHRIVRIQQRQNQQRAARR